MTDVLLATRNPGKLVELRRMLDAAEVAGIRVLGLADVPEFPEEPETGATFAENALAKALDAAKATGLASVADDSGLAVDALNGMPGVLSARWSGRHGDDRANLELVLGQLADVSDDRRGADERRTARDQRLRLRPDLRPGRRRPDVGGAGAGREGRAVAPRPRAARTPATPAGAGRRVTGPR